MSKVSAKSVIEDGITSGKSVAVILSSVAKKVPDSKADESHVRFYANKMLRDGTLDEETAKTKYGCGARGRKATADKPAKAVKVKAAATDTPAKAARVKKVAVEAPAVKKSVASKKSASAGSAKTSATRKTASKAK